MPIVDTERSFVATETVETPGTPVTENSRSKVVDIDLWLTISLIMNCVVVELRD